MISLTLASPAQTRKLARVLAVQLRPPALVTVEGDLGTGKTTLVREVLRARGVRGAITSPSFTLAQSYHGRERRAAAPPRPVPAQPRRRRGAVRLGRLPRAGRDHVRRVAGGRQRRAAGGRTCASSCEHRTRTSRARADCTAAAGAGARTVAARPRRRPASHGGRGGGVVILALETATTACSAALCAADGSVVAERVSLDGPAHSQRLLPFVHEVLAEAGAGWDDVDTVAVGLGPGAFTGLRIGIATARALAQADGACRPRRRAHAGGARAGAGARAGGGSRPARSCRSSTAAAARCSRPSSRPRTAAACAQVEDVAVVPADDLAAWLARPRRRGRGRRRRRAVRRAAAGDGAAGRRHRRADGRHGRPGGRLRRARPRPRPGRGAAPLRPRPGREPRAAGAAARRRAERAS